MVVAGVATVLLGLSASAGAHHLQGRTSVEPEPSRTSASSWALAPGDQQFPTSVWLQDPVNTAAQYKAMGVTTFLGLWDWPGETGKYPGWAQATLDTLATQGMNAYAAENPTAARTTLGMRNSDRVSGWLAGDEPDMFGPAPVGWAAKIEGLTAVQDRPVAGNFGLGFGGFGWWYDHISDADRAAWCAPVDLPSVDYYGMTKPEAAPEERGAWTYGRAINNLRTACGDQKPLGAFVELTEINEHATAQTPEGIRAAAWNAVVNGADAIHWFVHDFRCNPECGPEAFLHEETWAANRAAMTVVNTELHRWAPVLGGPDLPDPIVTGIPLDTLVKEHAGVTYVFAQATGGPDATQGYTGQATVTIDGRSFTDDWSPYQLRVYEVC